MRALSPSSLVRLEGTIAGCGFASGDRFVAGIWERGPLGAMNDLMWARPNGERILLAPNREVARFVGGVYDFDETQVVPFELLRLDAQNLHIAAGPVELELHVRRPLRLFRLRPKALRRSRAWVRVEDALMRPLVGRFVLRGAEGVHGYGVNPSGVREWYAIDSYAAVTSARGRVDGRDLGGMAPLDPPVRFGFSEFPSRPAVVRCAPILEGAERFLPRGAAQPSGSGRTGRR